MNIVALEEVSKTFGIKPLLNGVSFAVAEGEKIGLIGANGSGKSTLLKLIAGIELPDSGRVVTTNGKRITYLSQTPDFDPEQSVLSAVVEADRETLQVLEDYEQSCNALAAAGGADERLLAKVAELAHQIEIKGAWELETRARNILQRLQLSDVSAKLGQLSGGQRKRVALAHALLVETDLLILDEPTNHLDAETVEWLEEYLEDSKAGLLIVTHDRYFLDRVTNSIVEIDRGVTRRYEGNYAYFLEKKEQQEEIKRTEGQRRDAMIRRELAWLRRGAKARTTKQKARVDRATALISAPREQEKAELEIGIRSRRLGSKIIEIEGVRKSFDGKCVVNNFSYILKKGERIGFIGPNGSGKTTLLEIIAGRLKPDEGSIATGETVALGYYDQESRALNDEQRVIDYIREVAERVETSDGEHITASQMLGRFLFPPEMQFTPIAKLSGGERRRLYLLRMLMATPNVLILDEITNDLDLNTLVVLEDYLDSFQGCLIVVSHDRYFLDRVVDKVFRFEGGGSVREYPGNYSAFLEIREREAALEAERKSVQTRETIQKTQESNPATKKKLSYKEGRELEELEKRIALNEERKASMELEMSQNPSDFVLIQRLDEELKSVAEELEKDMERWAELAEMADL